MPAKSWSNGRLDEYITSDAHGYSRTGDVVNSKTPVRMKCPNGHAFEMSPNNFATSGKRCRECYFASLRTTTKDFRAIAEANGYTLLTEVTNSTDHVLVSCGKGHAPYSVAPKRFTVDGHRCPTCRHEERIQRMSGPQNPSFNPLLLDDDRVDRRVRPEYKEWMQAVKERDNFTCQCCGKRGGDLESHHPDAFGSNRELRYSINNGVTLCKPCHRDFHKRYGFGRNTKTQYIEWIRLKGGEQIV